MQLEKYTPSQSRNTLIVMIAVLVIVAVVIASNLDYLHQVYFEDRITKTGIFANGLILFMFFLGLSKLVMNLLHYWKQEIAISNFLENDLINPDMAMASIDENSMISQRYQIIQGLWRKNAPIDHGALAAILVAGESSRNSVPRFVNNILILTGVFGTIVSLSIALLGASDLLQAAGNFGSMSLVVHGMSTALSTTITAIVCFMFFGYFHLRAMDTQTNIISVLEQVSMERLIPRFNVSKDKVLGDIASLVQALRNASEAMQQAQMQASDDDDGDDDGDGDGNTQIVEALQHQTEQLEANNQRLDEMLQTLRIGFRLDH